MSASIPPANTDHSQSHQVEGLMRREAIQVMRWLSQRNGRPLDEARLAASRARFARRQSLHAALTITYPDELPITAHVEEIRGLLLRHQVVIVAGETGSGKTTQLPKICLEAGFGIGGSIVHTQPRRLAARTVSSRIASELGTEPGDVVGYAVRFSDQTGEQTLVKLVTDGLLLTEIRSDRYLDAYDVVIVDEAHERSLNIDFLLGYLRRLLIRRRDLRVIVTSATIDVNRFAEYFGGAPIVQVSGRGYPVEVRHLAEEEAALPMDPEERLCQAVEQLATLPGANARDVLVFQTGEREIFESAKALRQRFGERYDILPLYARLGNADQNRVFAKGGRRRIILATNVAETSLTVPNIGFVIDPGLARLNRYSYRSKLTRLPIEPISQASANQRAGRCGRIAPGVCVRLFAENDFKARPAFTEPEIRRVNLASVVLQMRAFELGEIESFGFIEPPEPGAIRDAVRLLQELGALEGDRLTEIGRAMARLPVDPRLARMLVAAKTRGGLRELLIIVSALSIQDPRERPLIAQAAADAKHAIWSDPDSDFLSWIKLWDWLANVREQATRAGERRAHETHFLSHMRVREWRELHRQLVMSVRDLGWRVSDTPAESADVHRAVLAGSLSMIGMHEERGLFLGARGSKFRVFPGSGLRGRNLRWLVAAEIAETSQVYARCVAPVEPVWIEQAGAHLLARSHADPVWSVKRGEAQVLESVRLYGLPLAEKRPVRLAPIDPVQARELLIRDGLVAGAMPDQLIRQVGFIAANLAEQRAVVELETRARRRDLVIPEVAICAFYKDRLPDSVVDGVTLLRWWRGLGEELRASLRFDRAFLLRSMDSAIKEDDYPSTISIASMTFEVKYRFAPGAIDDGVNLRVPVGVLAAVVPELLDWSVPGYFGRVVESWLRTLPKSQRRILSPIADRVDAITRFLQHDDRYRRGRLSIALADALHVLHDMTVMEGEWDRSRIDANCLVNIQVVDPAGEIIRQGRDLEALLLASAPKHRDESADTPLRTDLRAFPAEGFRGSITVLQRGAPVLVYPALIDRGQSVDLAHLQSAAEAEIQNRRGYARLALLANADTARFLKKELTREKTLALQFASLGNAEILREEVLCAVAWQCFFEGQDRPAEARAFATRMAEQAGEMLPVYRRLITTLGCVLQERFDLVRLLDGLTVKVLIPAATDIRAQMNRLVPANVLAVTPAGMLSDLPRYLQALAYRVRNLQGNVTRDAERVREMSRFADRLERYRGHRLASTETFLTLCHQLEEVRVGSFAEPLVRKGLGSAVKLDRALLAAEQSIGLR